LETEEEVVYAVMEKIGSCGELVSIDENDISGKRKYVFGMKNRAVLKECKIACRIVARNLGN